ncbi:pre-mRNA-splicing factor prp46 [Geranomyces michiganensis]|nr:pre-mRNA-splicing factor prp46 [Geranomyces michiganensis]
MPGGHGPSRIKLNFGASIASSSSPVSSRSEHSQHHGPPATARRPPPSNQSVPPSTGATAPAAAGTRKGMTALEAARAFGAPIPLRKRSIQPSDSEEDDLIIDDDDDDDDQGNVTNSMEPYLQAGRSASNTPEPSGRIKLNFGATQTAGSTLFSKAESLSAGDNSDDAMMIDIGVDGPPSHSSIGGKRKFSASPSSGAHVKRVKIEIPGDPVNNDLAMDSRSNGSPTGHDSSHLDSPSLRHPRRAKARGKGFTQRRRPSDTKGVWKPRKKSLHTILSKLITSFRQKDVYGFFLDPVDTSVVTDYMTVVKEPMDLGTMEKKVRRREYKSCAEFKRDFNLVVVNAKTYNSPDTVYFKAAAKLEAYGNRAIEREEPNIDIVHERTEPRPPKASSKPAALPEVRRLADTKKSSLKKMTHTERLALRRGDLYEPDGTSRKDDFWTEPLSTPFEELLSRFSSQRQDSWACEDAAQLPHGIHDYGPYQYREIQPSSTNYILQRDAYGDATGEAYVKSLERFASGLPPAVTAHASKIIARATRGGHALVCETLAETIPATTTFASTTAANTAPPPSTPPPPPPPPPPLPPTARVVETDWGLVDVAARLRRARPDVNRVIREAEIELWRREGVDIVPLLRPKALGSHDKELARELETNNMMLLLERNCADLAKWWSSSQREEALSSGAPQQAAAATVVIAATSGDNNSASTPHPQSRSWEEEVALAERVRRRLLQLVQKAPPREFESAKNLPSVEAIQSMYMQAGAVTPNTGSPRASPGLGAPSAASSPATPSKSVPF